MPLRMIVCVKQVPGTSQVEIDSTTGVLKRDGVESKLNPYDLYSLEAALSLSSIYRGEVRTLSMGPPQAKAVLLEAIYMGADSGVLVSDKRFAGSDVLATAYTLSQAIKCLGEYDLIICGKQTTDGDTAQVGAELAEFLSVPHACHVLSVEPQGTNIVARLSQGDQIITQRMPMPCLLCMDSDINTPRLPSYKRKKGMLSEPIVTLTLDDFIDKDASHYGLSGSPTQVDRIFPPEKCGAKEVFTGSTEELSTIFARILVERKFV